MCMCKSLNFIASAAVIGRIKFLMAPSLSVDNAPWAWEQRKGFAFQHGCCLHFFIFENFARLAKRLLWAAVRAYELYLY